MVNKTAATVVLIGAVATGIASPALASSFSSRTVFFNANMFQLIDADTGMSFSVWKTKRRTVERDGGKPEIVESIIAGYCLTITTCVTPSGPCSQDTKDCGEFTDDAVVHAGKVIRFTTNRFVYEYTIERRGLTNYHRRDRTLAGMLTEDHSRTESTDGTGTLSSPYGSYSGFAYHNEGVARHKDQEP
ncbi:MAG: hypothetical protein AAB417_00515 [Patescibacteria group bacterium]